MGRAIEHGGYDVEGGVHRAHSEPGQAAFGLAVLKHHGGRGGHGRGGALHAEGLQLVAVRNAVHFAHNQGFDVFVVDRLFLVGQGLDGLEHGLELVVAQGGVAQGLQLVAHGVAARMLADDKIGAGAADGLRGHDFVSFAVFEHTVLVDAGFMGEGVAAHNGLVGRNGLTDDHGQQPAGREKLFGPDVGIKPEHVVPHLEGHDHFLQRGVARPFADAGQSHLGLSGSGLEGGQSVGHAQPQVVVAVHAEHGLVGVGGVLDDVADKVGVDVGNGIAHGVGQVDGGGSGLDDLGHHPDQKVRVRARGVLG